MRLIAPTLALMVVTTLIAPSAQASPPNRARKAPYLVASLKRTMCFGTCPAYVVNVFSNGLITWSGESDVSVLGQATSWLSPQRVSMLHAAFKRARYFELDSDFDCAGITDAPSAITSYNDGKREKTINHYLGCIAATGDEVLVSLEKRIDEIVGTRRWIE